MMASEFPPGPFYIKSRKHHMCLDVEGGSKREDTPIVVWPQKRHNRENQLWTYEDGFLVNVASRLVIDVRGGALKPVAQIIQYSRKLMQSAHNQRWTFREGYIYPIVDPALVLDIRGDSGDEGAAVILYQRQRGEKLNQMWYLEPAEGDYPQGQAYYPPSQQYAPPPSYGQGYDPAHGPGMPARHQDMERAHAQVYHHNTAHLSHELIAGAAAFEAMRAYEKHQEARGEPVKHAFAKEALVAIAMAEAVKLMEERGFGGDREAAKRDAARAAEQEYDRRYNY
ncbi:hypothetical protein BZG36_03448 [Bifiguratus adelaidae]|uniref:Ricin B lectin domain-containing protein n=1 Tax=Bifiguratus adelaidae TaxID=1938954 RepID=A0A261XY09_9FUNG|nr:hypothetical protein BZG36_03448 [Bifiguratus adelaidae]